MHPWGGGGGTGLSNPESTICTQQRSDMERSTTSANPKIPAVRSGDVVEWPTTTSQIPPPPLSSKTSLGQISPR